MDRPYEHREAGDPRRDARRPRQAPPLASFDEKAIQAVEEVLRPGRSINWTGRKGMEFEKRFAAWQGSAYGVSVATGTAGCTWD